MLRQQVDALPAPSRLCLRMAAALGDDFHLGELQAAMAVEGDVCSSCSRPRTRCACSCATPSAPSRAASATPASARPSTRASIRPSARAFTAASPTRWHALRPDGSGARLSAIAHHYHEAAAAGGADNAVRFGCSRRTPRTAPRAYEDAIAHCRRVLSVLPMARPADPRARHEAQLLLGHALRLVAGGVEQVREAYAQAASAALEARDPDAVRARGDELCRPWPDGPARAARGRHRRAPRDRPAGAGPRAPARGRRLDARARGRLARVLPVQRRAGRAKGRARAAFGGESAPHR